MSVRIESNHRLKYRANHLKGQSDQANLRKAQAERFLEEWIDGRKQRLHGVVEQMAKTQREQDAQRGILQGRGGLGCGRRSSFFCAVHEELRFHGPQKT